jgi:hypothetical protein
MLSKPTMLHKENKVAVFSQVVDKLFEDLQAIQI